MSHDRYAHLTEPVFGTVLHETDRHRQDTRLIYVFAPNSDNQFQQWLTSYGTREDEQPFRFSTNDVWVRAKNPDDPLVIIYDPRVDYV